MEKGQWIKWKTSEGPGGRGSEAHARGLFDVSRGLLDAVCALIFLYATRRMIGDVYPWGVYSIPTVVMIILDTIIISFGLDYVLGLGKEWAKKFYFCILGVWGVILFWVLFIGPFGKELLSGTQGMIDDFIAKWNDYYGSSISVREGDIAFAKNALDTLLLFLFFALIWLAKLFRANLILAIPAIAVFMTELMVGYSAGQNGVFAMVGGILLANTMAWKGSSPVGKHGGKASVLVRYLWVVVGVVIIAVFALVKGAGTDSANRFVYSADEIRGWFNELFSDLPKGGDGSGEGGIDSDDQQMKFEEKLSNSKPNYRYRSVMDVTLSSEPLGTIYLKGFYGDQYSDQMWSADFDAFSAWADSLSLENNVLSQNIAFREVNHLKESYQVIHLSDSMLKKQMSIQFLMKNSEIYLPYFAEFDIGESGVGVSGDSVFYRKEEFKQIDVNLWHYENQYRGRLDLLTGRTRETWERSYENYVNGTADMPSHYLEVPEEIADAISQVADQLKSGLLIGGYSENDLRLFRVEQVVKWMEANTTYSLDLDQNIGKYDPIEYFLLHSKKGYCMHYASASTMILRALGVPARIATGFVLGADSFEAADGKWKAKVLDSQAHAWVEIYLNGIGWVPCEVTNGFGGSVPSFIYGNNSQETETESFGVQETVPDETEINRPIDRTEGQTVPEKTQPDKTKAPSERDTLPESTTQSAQENQGIQIDWSKLIKPILVAVGCLMALGTVIYIIARILYEYREKLMREIRKKRMSIAIRIMNRRIYQKLRITGKILVPDLRDKGYEEILKKNYPDISAEDWVRYMEIAKKAAFSELEISEEDTKFFYGIYRKVRPRS